MRQRGIPSLTLPSISVGEGGREQVFFSLKGLDMHGEEGDLRSGESKLFFPLRCPPVPAPMSPCSIPASPPAPTLSPKLSPCRGLIQPHVWAYRTLTILLHPLSGSVTEESSSKRANRGRKKTPPNPTKKKKKSQEGRERGGCSPATHSQCLNKGLPWVHA